MVSPETRIPKSRILCTENDIDTRDLIVMGAKAEWL